MVNRIILFSKGLSERQLLLLLIGITFVLRLYAVLMAQGIANDSAAYGFIARDFLKGDFIKGLSFSAAPPLYPFLIFLFSPDTSHVEIVGRFISLFSEPLLSSHSLFPVKKAIGQREAIFTALFYSFHPYLVTYSGMLLTELRIGGYWFHRFIFSGQGWKNRYRGKLDWLDVFLDWPI